MSCLAEKYILIRRKDEDDVSSRPVASFLTDYIRTRAVYHYSRTIRNTMLDL